MATLNQFTPYFYSTLLHSTPLLLHSTYVHLLLTLHLQAIHLFFLAGTWINAVSREAEHQIQKNQLVTTIPILRKEWKVSFEFKANTFGSSFRQLLHMSIGGRGTGRGSKYGDRTPAIWTHSSRGFLIASAVNGKYSYAKYFKGLPKTGEWVNIEIGQEIKSSKMVYFIVIGGTTVLSTTNSKPAEFKNVKVFTSSNWYTPLSGSIRNLLVENKDDGRLFRMFKISSVCF